MVNIIRFWLFSLHISHALLYAEFQLYIVIYYRGTTTITNGEELILIMHLKIVVLAHFCVCIPCILYFTNYHVTFGALSILGRFSENG